MALEQARFRDACSSYRDSLGLDRFSLWAYVSFAIKSNTPMSGITLNAIEQMLNIKLGATDEPLIKRVDESQEELARTLSTGLEDLQNP